jgi:hypothetical protein
MLQDFIAIQQRLAGPISTLKTRSLYHQINWDMRLIGLVGARGTGKTTLVLQHYLERYKTPEKCLYVSADNPLLLRNGIYFTASEYFKYQGECIIIDEVHKQAGWSDEIKALYDAYPDKKIIVLGSAMLNILETKGDLSRRMLVYTLPELSFREYLNIRHGTDFPVCSFDTLVQDHVQLAESIRKERKTILRDFEMYCQTGSFPFFITHSVDEYLQILSQVIDKVIYEDLSALKSLRGASARKLKILLAWLSAAKTPQISVSSLTNELDVARDTLYEYLELLQRSRLINIAHPKSSGRRSYKRSKILFSTPNTYFSIQRSSWMHATEKGNLREAFFLAHANVAAKVWASATTDYLLQTPNDSYEIEVGGPNKDSRQLHGVSNGLLFLDGIETGFKHRIPLYLAGFLH